MNMAAGWWLVVGGRAGTRQLPTTNHRPLHRALYFRCVLLSFVISNMLTVFLPANTGFSLSSALMLRLFLASCSPFFLMYAQSFLVTSVRGIGLSPITSPSAALGVMGFMKAALAFRAVFFFAVLAIKSPFKLSRGSFDPLRAGP